MSRRNDWIEFSLVSFCRLQCAYCPQTDIIHKAYPREAAKQMTLETFTKVLDNLPTENGKVSIGVDFSGYSDPTLNPNFIHFFQLAVARCEVVSLFTTFDGLSKAHYDILKTIPFENLSVHLPDAEELIKVRWERPDYLQIMHALVDDPPICRVQDRMVVKGPLHPNLSFLEPVRVMPIQPRANLVTNELSRHEGEKFEPLKCSRGVNLRQNVCLPDGRVALCCCSYNLDPILGDLTKQHYYALDEARAKVIERQKNPDAQLLCHTCEFAVPLNHPM